MQQGSGCGAVGREVASIPEIRGSIPIMGNFIYYKLCRKDENKEKEAENSQM